MILTSLYTELDGLIREATEQTGLSCAPGCGLCCQRPSREIEVSPWEWAALARELWQDGRGEDTLARARAAGAEGRCIWYQTEAQDGPFPRGRCQQYEHRPLTCRLFGFGVVRGKSGLRPLLSSVMKQRDPDAEARVQRAVSEGVPLPVAADWRLRLAELAPEAATELMPLNVALARALEKEGLAFRFRSLSQPPASGR